MPEKSKGTETWAWERHPSGDRERQGAIAVVNLDETERRLGSLSRGLRQTGRERGGTP